MGYFNLSPKLIQDNKMHIVYPVNISESNAETDINSVHNLDDNTKTLGAACGAIWINRMDGCQEDAGFIHNSDICSYAYRCPSFYNTLFIYKPDSNIDEDGDMANIANYKFWSYGHMLSTYTYRSPHFTDHSLSETARFISNESIRGKTLLYRLSSDVHIYDPLISSYYVDITEGNDRVKTFFYPSRLSAKYNIWPQMDGPKEDALRVNVDTMLKYLIDVDYEASRTDHYVWKLFDVSEDGCSKNYWWQPDSPSKISWYNANSVDVFPSYLTIESNGSALNERGSQSDYAQFLADHGVDRICLNRLDSRNILSTTQDYSFDDVVKNHPYSLISMGDLTSCQELTPPRWSRFISVISNAITYAFLNRTKYVKVYTSDSKWISVPYQDRMGYKKDAGYNVTIPEYGRGLYTAKYIAPLNVDHLVRQWNVRAVESRADGHQQYRQNKVLFSGCPIMSYRSTRSGIWRLYNSANMINSIRWDHGRRTGKLTMQFENTADMMIDGVIPNKVIPAPPIDAEEEMDWVVDVRGTQNFIRGYYYCHELGTLHVTARKHLKSIGVDKIVSDWSPAWICSHDGNRITHIEGWQVRPKSTKTKDISYNNKDKVMCYIGTSSDAGTWIDPSYVALTSRKLPPFSDSDIILFNEVATQNWWDMVDHYFANQTQGFNARYVTTYVGTDGKTHVSSFIAYVYEVRDGDCRIFSTTKKAGKDWILYSTVYDQSDSIVFEHDESCKVTRIRSEDGKNVYKFYVMLQDKADPTKFVKTVLCEDKWEYDPDIAPDNRGVYQPEYKRFEEDFIGPFMPASLSRYISKFSDKYVKTMDGKFIKVSDLYTGRSSNSLLFRAANFHSVKLYNTNK